MKTPSQHVHDAREYLALLRQRGDTTTTLASLLSHIPGALVTDDIKTDPLTEAQREYLARLKRPEPPLTERAQAFNEGVDADESSHAKLVRKYGR
jgi:hypothetical protein